MLPPASPLHSLWNQLRGPPAPLLAQKDAHFTLWIRAEGLHTRRKTHQCAHTHTQNIYTGPYIPRAQTPLRFVHP